MIRTAIFVGTRPEIIKMAPVIKNCQEARDFELILVHVGQHYDYNMSISFLRELNLPKPNGYLNVRSGVVQFSKVILRATSFLSRTRPDVVLVEGDTNSAAGVALASAKLAIPVAHVEAGCRSFDRRMQEEINRLVIADCAEYHFAPTRTCKSNLLQEGIDRKKIFLTGHPIVQTVNQMLPKIQFSEIVQKLGLDSKGYALLTVHRAETVDDEKSLSTVINALAMVPVPIVFPIHPRTKLRLKQFGLLEKALSMGIRTIEPCDYVATLRLIADSAMVLTDSGGIQQECAILKTPCITLRSTTEWVETVKAGVNFLAPPEFPSIEFTVKKVYCNLSEIRKRFIQMKRLFGDETASSRIVGILRSRMPKGR